MIYTCYEMIRDCRAGAPEGWRYFVSTYVPVVRRVVAQYSGSTDDAMVERVLRATRDPQSSLFQNLDPAPERWFVAELRQKVLSELPAPPAEHDLSLETVAEAFAPLTLREKQVVWFETMRYDDAMTGTLLRMSPETAGKIRARAADLLRGKLDRWSRTILGDTGLALGRAASAASSKDCLPPKPFLDVVDGRTTWSGREELERHVSSCWHCIDHFCRLVEVVELLRGSAPLADAETARYCAMLSVAPAKSSGWKRWLGAK